MKMKTEIRKFESLTYIVRFPYNYVDGEKYPVIFFLHGAGGRGNNIEVLKENPYFTLTEKHKDFSFITVAPQCSGESWFDLFEQVKRLLIKTANESFTDPERIYGMGASMGGYGTWQLAMSMPEYFAAIAPICGGGMYWLAYRLVNVPAWAFHGALDNVVNPEESIKMAAAVNNGGGNAKITIYPKNDHDAWSDTYSNREVFDWLLEQKNENAGQITNTFEGSEIFG